MLRHLDCAWEVRGPCKLVGFYIVEGNGDSDAVDVPDRWIKAAKDTISDSVLEASLPHRTSAERTEIARCFSGVTTWQAVCRALDLDWNKLPPEVDPEADDV
jgi:hypothetical protein